MTRASAIVAAATLLLLAMSSHAARPTSIVFNTNAETADGKPYAQFTVTCNDGRSIPLTAWEGRRKWCVGDIGEPGEKIGNFSCNKKQISAAHTACMDTATPAASPDSHV